MIYVLLILLYFVFGMIVVVLVNPIADKYGEGDGLFLIQLSAFFIWPITCVFFACFMIYVKVVGKSPGSAYL